MPSSCDALPPAAVPTFVIVGRRLLTVDAVRIVGGPPWLRELLAFAAGMLAVAEEEEWGASAGNAVPLAVLLPAPLGRAEALAPIGVRGFTC